MVKQNVCKPYPKQPLIYHSRHSKGWCTASSSVRSDSVMGFGWRLQSEVIPQKLKSLPKDTLPSSENVSQHNGDISSPFFSNSKNSNSRNSASIYKTHSTGVKWLWLPFLLSFITSASYFLWNSVHLLPFTARLDSITHPPGPAVSTGTSGWKSRKNVLCLLTGTWVVHSQRGKCSRDKHWFEEQYFQDRAIGSNRVKREIHRDTNWLRIK